MKNYFTKINVCIIIIIFIYIHSFHLEIALKLLEILLSHEMAIIIFNQQQLNSH